MRNVRSIPVLVLFGAAALGAESARSVWDGVYTGAQALRGQALFRKECASCHGASLAGGKDAPALTGPAFWAAWNGVALAGLFERIRQTMPDDDPGRLSRAQNADLLAYLLSANRFPAGDRELEQQTEALERIRIEEKKPR